MDRPAPSKASEAPSSLGAARIHSKSRLAALRATELLDAASMPTLDRLVRLASKLLRAPIALVSLIDEHRQFFSSAVGIEGDLATTRETPLSHSFCQYVVRDAAPLIVEDARKHPCLHDSLAVTEYGVKAYAGVPLVLTEGEILGALCVVDMEVHRWSSDDVDTLRDLARAVVAEIELRTLTSALRQRNELLETVLACMDDAVIVSDPEGGTLLFNDAAGRILERGPAKTRDQEAWVDDFGIFLPDGQRCPPSRLPLVRALEGETVRQTSLVVRTPSNPEGAWHSVNASPLRDAMGVLRGAVTVGRDVTEVHALSERVAEKDRREAQELREAKAQLEAQNLSLAAARDVADRANAAKSVFLAHMSHEFRTPMNAVLGVTSLLLETPLVPLQRDYLETIRNSGAALLSILNEVLDLAKIESGTLELELAPFSISRCVRDAADLLSPAAKAKNLDLRVVLAKGVPEAIVGDASRLRQVLVNLVANAVKFTERGSVTIDVQCAPSDQDDAHVTLHFAVRDTGPGIPEERQNELFQPFNQIDSAATPAREGTGLGLAISRRIVETMGGTIGVTSAPGEGATFYVHLDARVADVAPIAESPAFAVYDETLGARYPLRVLLAEDNVVNQKVGVHMLERFGYHADVVASGLEAVRSLEERPYDVVLMDMFMPEMDGLEATRRLRAYANASGAARPWIVAMTASALAADRARFFAAGADDYVSKPVAPEALAGALLRAAEQKRLLPRSGPSDKPPVLDELVLGSITQLVDGDTAALFDLIGTFVSHGEELVDAIAVAAEKNDMTSFHRHVHSLKGSAGTFGAAQVFRLCCALEGSPANAPDGHPLVDLAAQAKALRSAFVAARQALVESGRLAPESVSDRRGKESSP